MGEAVIEVEGLCKRYGAFEAVKGIDLHVKRGEVFAFLGPNGAGKTTSVEIFEGFRHRDDGRVSVLGVDPDRGGLDWRARIGVVLQESRPEPLLTVRESIAQYAGFYPRPRPVDEVIRLVGLDDAAGVRAGKLSGGQQRRLDVGLALVGRPEVVFLDEPTTGFDPTARREAWAVLEGLKAEGLTVFLTTHYLEEAEVLADRVAVIAGGRIVAEGTPATLAGRNTAQSRITYRIAGDAETHVAHSDDVVADLQRLFTRTKRAKQTITELEVTRPSLEDVYLDLVADP
ncbi:MAG TPA: ABC transporter ATP-binding protein [Acidimicrobiales bacterium]|nr:ABC transporter ATP-binding protein [Acidimicrobiales bacterium]